MSSASRRAAPTRAFPDNVAGPRLDLGACFAVAFDRIAADDEVDYGADPPAPPLNKRDALWTGQLLRACGLRKKRTRRGRS
jgi:hypothetical protein